MSESGNIGIIVRELRKRAGLTQDDLAEQTGRSVDAISQIERGVNSPTIDTLLRFAKALEVTPEAFLIGMDVRNERRRRALAAAMAALQGLSERDLDIAVEQIRAFTRSGS